MSDESNAAKKFDAILEDTKNNKSTTKFISFQSCSRNISLHLLVIKLLNFIFLMK